MTHPAYSLTVILPRLLRRLALLPLLWLAGQAFAQSWSYIPVYNNGMDSLLNYYTWTGETNPIEVNVAATAPGKSGTALELNFPNNVWNSFVIHRRYAANSEYFDWGGAYYLNEVRSVEFDLYVMPDAVDMERMAFIVDDFNNSDAPRLVDYIAGWDSMSDADRLGHWYHISIPLADLHPKGTHFSRIIFNETSHGSSASPHPHFLLYDLKLGVQPDTTPPSITLNSASNDVAYSAVTLNFSTNELSTYTVRYGVGALDHQVKEVDSYGNVLWNTDHTATLSGFSPGDTVQYQISVSDHTMDAAATGNQTTYSGNYALPPKPTQPPAISGFTTGSVGAHTATLLWNTDRGTSAVLTYQKKGGSVSTRSLADTQTSRSFVIDMLEPDSAYAVSLSVRDVFGLQSAQTLVLQTLSSGGGGAASVTATINAASQKPISPYIYGTNQYWSDNFYTFGRMGGDYMPTFNWSINAYNGGFWSGSSNDTWFMQQLSLPHAQWSLSGELVRRDLNYMMRDPKSSVEAALVTVQLMGYVAGDHGPAGDISKSGADYMQTRLKPIRMFKNAPFTLMPDPDEAYIYMDEFVNWVNRALKPSFPGKKIFYSMDNEPDIWSGTHSKVMSHLNSYDEICQKNEDGASAVKSVDPNGLVFGLVSYGWYGWTMMQGGPNGNNGDFNAKGDFTEYYLKWMKDAATRAGKRLIDVLDYHVYATAQNAQGQGVISTDTSPAMVAMRVQSPRQLWDPSYIEADFWVTNYLPTGDKGMRILPRMQAKIDQYYPGTKIAITEYNYGGGLDMSGAVAQADVLGIYGQYGVFAANLWAMNLAQNEVFIRGAFRMFRGFDGGNANFGDISLFTTSSDTSKVAVYASLDSRAPAPGRAVIVAINRDSAYQNVAIQGIPLSSGTVKAYRMEGLIPAPYFLGEQSLDSSTLTVNLPPMTVTTFDIH